MQLLPRAQPKREHTFMLSNKPQRRYLRIGAPSQEKDNNSFILRSIQQSYNTVSRTPTNYAKSGGGREIRLARTA